VKLEFSFTFFTQKLGGIIINVFNIPYDKMIIVKEKEFKKQRVFLQKTKFTAKDLDHFFIKIYIVNKYGNYVCQGYIYFYVNFLEKESNFIGVYVNPEYRNEGIAQLLISYWVTICLDNGIYNLNTIKRQRKPFILYLLKKFKFDLIDTQKYETDHNTISICKNSISNKKCLFFKNPEQAETFKNGNIKNGDNYNILEIITEDTQILDHVLLSNLYFSKDDNKAYTRSLKLINEFTNK